MKRYRFGEMDSLNSMANVLMLLSRGGGGGGGGPGGGAEDSDDLVQSSSSSSPERVFECKTCNRQFPSFQALGGHRASHKKLRLAAGDGDAHGQAQAKPRVHECSICGLEFAVGQALGGHMRRHRGTAAAAAKPGDQRGVLLDLNLPPLENDPKLGLGLEIVDMIPMVDCLH